MRRHEVAVLQGVVAVNGYICLRRSRGSWEGVAVKADALARSRPSLVLSLQTKEARGVQFYATNGDVESGNHR